MKHQTFTPDLPVRTFIHTSDWRDWLEKHHAGARGLWLRISNKGSGSPTITYGQALDEALCYGWIDGQTRGYDDSSHIQRFTPRRSKSIWSIRNTEHIARLTKLGKMKPAGRAAVAAAKADGRWDRAYESSSTMKVPDDFLTELGKNKKAMAFFKTLNKANTYAISWRITTAKRTETRKRRIDTLIAMLSWGKAIHE